MSPYVTSHLGIIWHQVHQMKRADPVGGQQKDQHHRLQGRLGRDWNIFHTKKNQRSRCLLRRNHKGMTVLMKKNRERFIARNDWIDITWILVSLSIRETRAVGITSSKQDCKPPKAFATSSQILSLIFWNQAEMPKSPGWWKSAAFRKSNGRFSLFCFVNLP